MALTTSPLAPVMLWRLLDADSSYFGKALEKAFLEPLFTTAPPAQFHQPGRDTGTSYPD